MGWQQEGKKVSDAEKIVVIDRLKQLVNEALTGISKSRLWKVPQPKWQGAYEPRGAGSTFTRKQRVRDIFVLQVPVPQSISDRWAQAWVEEIKGVVNQALEKLGDEQSAEDKQP